MPDQVAVEALDYGTISGWRRENLGGSLSHGLRRPIGLWRWDSLSFGSEQVWPRSCWVCAADDGHSWSWERSPCGMECFGYEPCGLGAGCTGARACGRGAVDEAQI